MDLFERLLVIICEDHFVSSLIPIINALHILLRSFSKLMVLFKIHHAEDILRGCAARCNVD